MAQGGKSEMYAESAAELNHYIIHMYEKECIIYEQVASSIPSAPLNCVDY